MKALLAKAKKIISQIKYLNLATITPDHLPWNSPVYVSYDKNLNFYWLSWKNNQHSKNIRNNSNVFATIYDSTVPEGTGFGVYLQGQAYEVTNPAEMLVGLATHYGRVSKKIKGVQLFLKKFPRRVYKFVPEKIWLNGDDKIDGNYIDVRTELDLSALKKIFRDKKN